jgi:hypothetical protein
MYFAAVVEASLGAVLTQFMLTMQNCPNTGLSVPECACPSCLERQFDQFAPEYIRVRRVRPEHRHSPITLITSRFGRPPSNSA